MEIVWYHFEFASGANPYIAKTADEARKVIRHQNQEGNVVEKLSQDGFYLVHDKEQQYNNSMKGWW